MIYCCAIAEKLKVWRRRNSIAVIYLYFHFFFSSVNMNEEMRRHATPELAATMYQDGNNTCLYGVCHYCTPTDPVCGNGDIMEGALILWLPSYLKLTKHRNPWQRTYKKNKLALWEIDEHYCDKVGHVFQFEIFGISNFLK